MVLSRRIRELFGGGTGYVIDLQSRIGVLLGFILPIPLDHYLSFSATLLFLSRLSGFFLCLVCCPVRRNYMYAVRIVLTSGFLQLGVFGKNK